MLSLSDSNGKFSLTGQMLKIISDAGKDLRLVVSNLEISLPPQAISLNHSEELVISAEALDHDKSHSYLTDEQQVIGNIYEFFASKANSLTGVDFNRKVTVTIKLAEKDVKDLAGRKQGVFNFNEKLKAWRLVSAKIDLTKKTAVFTTDHFSKYAVLAYTEAAAENNPDTVVPPTASAPRKFADLNGHWAQDKIYALVDLGIVSGVSATEFAPQREITRAEFATLLLKAIDLQPGVQYRGKFSDVPANAWYFAMVNAAAEAGLVNGYGNGRFGPDNPVTREQMAVMIHNALTYKGITTNLTDAEIMNLLTPFSDYQGISSGAHESIAAVLKQNIMSGRGNGVLAPRGRATRAEAAVMILQMYAKH